MRKSNIELLRIVAAVLVLISHADYNSLGEPAVKDINSDIIGTSLRVFWEHLSVVAVDVFVLISGWFGIRATSKGFFRVLFPAMLVPVIIVSIHSIFTGFDLREFGRSLYFGSSYWFIPAYLILYIFAPIMNLFIERCSPQKVLSFLVAFFALEFVYGWSSFDFARFYSGYSAISFIGLYSLARYVRLYREKFVENHSAGWFLSIFSAIIILSSIFVCICLKLDLSVISDVVCRKFIAYNSPTVIMSALFLLLAFTKMEFYSRMVNIIAPASFVVYLLNANSIILPLFCKWCKMIYEDCTLMGYLLRLLLCIIAFFALAWALNIVCSFLWKKIENQFFNKRSDVQIV